MQFVLTSSLEKILSDIEPKPLSRFKNTVLQDEHYAFQLAYKQEAGTQTEEVLNLKILGATQLLRKLTLSKVEEVPVAKVYWEDMYDDGFLFLEPRLAPDVLRPVTKTSISPQVNHWQSVWLEIHFSDVPKGQYSLTVAVENTNGDTIFDQTLEFNVLSAKLPEQKLIHTQWFHVDALAHYYDEEVFSEKLWEIVGNYFATAKAIGINMILTPVFTPPLDTKEGGERLTVQLVKIKKTGTQYHFDFTDLGRWIELAQSNGIEYFEIAHLFTQWGAKHAPKIVVEINGREEKLFGWHTDASGEDYSLFLSQFLPALKNFMAQKDLLDRTYFHISDEPNVTTLDSYRRAKAVVEPFLQDVHIIDALSDVKFYEEGIIHKPIPSNDHIEAFIAAGIENLWTYYCCAQSMRVSNRFIAQKSAITRILGTQLYLFKIEGFLHWGFNFYMTQHSLRPLDPFNIKVEDGAFPTGDQFIVYPGDDGQPLYSIRARVFLHGLEDLRALQLLESLSSREEVYALIHENIDYEIRFQKYPKEADYLLDLREKINQKIEGLSM